MEFLASICIIFYYIKKSLVAGILLNSHRITLPFYIWGIIRITQLKSMTLSVISQIVLEGPVQGVSRPPTRRCDDHVKVAIDADGVGLDLLGEPRAWPFA